MIRRSESRQLEPRTQLLVGGGEVFGDNACSADGGHEICIARPARQDVKMDVVHNPGASGFSEVHAQIEPRRLICGAQGSLTTLRQIHQLVSRFLRGAVQLADVLVRNYEQVATDVRVDIENDKTAGSAVEHKVSCVMLRVGLDTTEDATASFGVLGAAGSDVFVTPGTPERLHLKLFASQAYIMGG